MAPDKTVTAPKRKAKIPSGWRSMASAPRDGTMILVCESPNGEHWNVMPACYQRHLDNEHLEGFWGVWPSARLPIHLLQERGFAENSTALPVDFKAIALTPVCWQPMPTLESVEKLRRRASQVYAGNARARATP